MSREMADVETLLEREGLHAALRYLNSRTHHRFTGVYRYDGDMLRNVALFDRTTLELEKGDDVRMEDAYCALVRDRGASLLFDDARCDSRFAWRAGSAVVSYCGALIRDRGGKPFGTLCHFDILRCEPNPSELEFLDQVAPTIYGWMENAGVALPAR